VPRKVLLAGLGDLFAEVGAALEERGADVRRCEEPDDAAVRDALADQRPDVVCLVAPSDELRKWFDHVPERFAEFRSRYRDELVAHSEQVEELRRRAREGTLTIVYAARDAEHNNAVVLAELIRDG